eukprot:TRINITY_DN402_c3_g1_i1.p1 TRINITY_DN402_c3_g1~~TRINITY_DN402_c3_g1_i1.p1  ORF type:complete len:275 (-),score=31.52 TRINITY_DN402_c3_g1_i1:373-1197(-)
MDLVSSNMGPRLGGRLTAELILRSPQHMNCVGLYEISMRGNRIAVIENLGATLNQFDCMDFSDNAITKLDGFPKLSRLSTLLMSNNRISRIATGLNDVIPNLEWLILTNNQIRQLKDLDPLSQLKKLRVLSLVDNPITKQRDYWLYVVHICKNIKMLDFKKVKQKDREMAEQMFGGKAVEGQQKQQQQKISNQQQQQKQVVSSNVQQQIQQPQAAVQNRTPSAEELMAIKAAIANAQTIEEVRRLEQVLKSGQMPSNMQFGVQNQQTPGMKIKR